MACQETLRGLSRAQGAPAGAERPVKGAGAKFAVALQWLRRVRWRRFIGARFLAATAAATLLVQLIAFPAYAPGATGNVATEDVVYMLEGMGIRTGVDMTKLLAATNTISRLIGRPPVSRVASALNAVSGVPVPGASACT